MENAYKIILTLHIVFGSLSLITFWIPVFVKKGGDIHLKIGKIYVALMWVVVISATTLSILNVFRGYYIAAGFLGYLGVITAHPLWYGIAMLKYKKEVPKKALRINKIFNLTLFIGGLIMVIWSIMLGVKNQAVLLMIFGTIGMFASAPLVFKKQSTKSNWLADHIQGMVTTGIAAYTAFFAFGGQTFMGHIFSGTLVAIPWSLPTVIGVVLITRMKRKWVIAG